MIQLSIINQSTVISDASMANFTEALNIQITRDFYPIWGINAKATFYPTKVVPVGTWELVVLDNTDQAGALGYHELTSEGLPLAKVFAHTDEQYGLKWTITASHEAMETLVDPYVNLAAQVSNTQFYAYEVCDPCEDDQYGYQITLASGKTVWMSDFVKPSYFEPTGSAGPAGSVYDLRGHIKSPLILLTNGYVSVLNLTAGEGWTQVLPSLTTPERGRLNIIPGSRRYLRNINHLTWQRSTKLLSNQRPTFR